MSKPLDVPFNIFLLELTPDKLKGLRPITKLDIFDGGPPDFAEDGLFSTTIFGRVGDERRNYRFSYIDIKVPVMHPIIFNVLVKMKRLYGDILSGNGYAVWDNEIKDFVKSNAIEGSTGYDFFIQHWKDIDYGDTKSINRDQAVKLIQKYKDKAMTDKIIVLPAGLRDLEIDKHNRISEDEINDQYRRLVKISNTINTATVRNQIDSLDTPRYQIQLVFNTIYTMLSSLIEGKKKLLMGKWASRRIFNGTRNVITAMDTSVSFLGDKGAPDFNSTIVGLYQYLKATLPVSIFQVRRFLEPIFPDVNQPARLINKKTLKAEEAMLHNRYYNQWATNEGIERIISSFKEETIRDVPLEIDGRYLALLYRGPDNTFKVLHDIDEVPEGRSKDDVSPITLAELFYIAVYQKANSYPALVTRYPITGIGSIYPTRTYLRVTLKSERRMMLDDQWQPMGDDYIAYEFPVRKSAFVNSMSPHPAHLARLDADFDGDTMSYQVAYSQEAIAECEDFFNSKRAYVGTDGKFINRTDVYTVELVLRNMTAPTPAVVATEAYEGAGTFTHWGVDYDLGVVYAEARDLEVQTVPMEDLLDNLKPLDELDARRLQRTHTSIPLICVKEKGVIYVLDGNHRLYKLHKQGVKEVKVKFIDQAILDLARVDKTS